MFSITLPRSEYRIPSGVFLDAYGKVHSGGRTKVYRATIHKFDIIREAVSSLGSSHIFYGEIDNKVQESYLLATKSSNRQLAIALFSTGIQKIVGNVAPGSDLNELFKPENQAQSEEGVTNFLKEAEAKFNYIKKPKPQETLDFYGPYGLYAWELFFHIPLMIAAKYNQAGKHDAARTWLHKIYDPRAKDKYGTWRVRPLREDVQPISASAITDPDQIATENPLYYQLTILRHYLRTMIDQGDGLYRQETAESLREAKMWYVTAKNLFNESLMAESDISTRETWANPTLPKAGPTKYDPRTSFRPPYNIELREAYDSLEERLDNLRHWRSIDGEPLTIPLLASPIDPRQLQAAALTNIAPKDLNDVSQEELPYTFEATIFKAQETVKNLMYFGDFLNDSLWRRDAQKVVLSEADNALKFAENIGRASIVGEKQNLIRKREQIFPQRHSFIKNKTAVISLKKIVSMLAMKNKFKLLFLEMGANKAKFGVLPVTAALKFFPNVFGTSSGGAQLEAGSDLVEEKLVLSEANFKKYGRLVSLSEKFSLDMLDLTDHIYDNVRELTNFYQEIQQLDNKIKAKGEELDGFNIKISREQKLIDFHRSRSTNEQFNNWYVGRAKTLYSTCYDITLRYCRLAERAFQAETGYSGARFINPTWEAQYFGLLSGQSLMLDLQRMDLAFMERRPQMEHRLTVKLSELMKKSVQDEAGEASDRDINKQLIINPLKQEGRLFFKLPEALFEDIYPDEYDRRLKSVRIKLGGVEALPNIGGRLSLLGHCRPLPQGAVVANHNRTYNMFNPQHVPLLQAITNTLEMKSEAGRLLPFERCGVDSWWMLSFPGLVKKLADRKSKVPRDPPQFPMITKLKDVELEITYTARL